MDGVDITDEELVAVTEYREQSYLQLTGPVMKIDVYWQYLQIGNITIEFPEITQLLTDTQPSFSKS